MGDSFRVFAVLPAVGDDLGEPARRFAEETRALLAATERVETVDLSDLEQVREVVVRELL